MPATPTWQTTPRFIFAPKPMTESCSNWRESDFARSPYGLPQSRVTAIPATNAMAPETHGNKAANAQSGTSQRTNLAGAVSICFSSRIGGVAIHNLSISAAKSQIIWEYGLLRAN